MNGSRTARTMSWFPGVAALAFALLLALPLAAACSMVQPGGAQLGTSDNPLKMAFVPSSDSQKVLASGEPIGQLLEKETGYKIKVSVPTSYAAVIEAMGANNVDIGWLAPFAYVLAKDKFGAEVILASVRGGSKTYTGQIIVHVDSGIKDLQGLKGKKFAFVEPGSASGYLFPNALLALNGIDNKTFFSETTFAGGHDKVVIAVYNKQVDGGATFGDSVEGQVTDARTRVTSTLPDVMEKVKPIAKTDPIPNDTVSLRKGLPPDMGNKIRDGLIKVAASEDGKKALKDLYQIDGLAVSADSDYEPVRKAAKALNLNLEEELAPKKG
ncbi:MAG TPA: phosphate/phosphite/phosphonate ABC transporter substrate-binding protein [Chloroflexota bacterium]|nr:phosphate/phosphite/phosphonate ABC transporter substrate-binding protein [Chloroflexota bacterium]